MRRMKYLFYWLMAAVPATLVLGVGYAALQQNYRQSLNDPQIQMAEDAAARLRGGEAPAALAVPGAPPVDIGGSLDPWLAIYDAAGTPLVASAVLDNVPPRLPQDVFDTSGWLKHPNGTFYDQGSVAETRFTWQPRQGVRQAVVLVQTADKKYFVAAGRNMREVEQRIDQEGEIVFAGWVATMGAILAVELLYVLFVRRAESRR